MDNYDSILKEKKKYEVEEEVVKKFPWFKVDIICMLILVFVGYVIYFFSVLEPRQIFFDDLNKIKDNYQMLITPLMLNEFIDSSIDGTINIDNTSYKYSLIRDNNMVDILLSNDDNYLAYSNVGDNSYVKLSTFKDKYLNVNNERNYIKILKNVKNNLSNYLTKDKFIRRFYFDGDNPIVASDLSLDNNDLMKIMGINSISDTYEVLVNLKNHAITNKIISIKVTINNKTKDKRYVINIENNRLYYKDKDNNLIFELVKNNNDFTLKIYRDKVLYSVLSGTKKESTYEYSYRVIDKVYSIDLDIKKDNDLISYNINSVIEKDEKRINSKLFLTVNISSNGMIEDIDIDNAVDYSSLSKEEKEQYKDLLNSFLDRFNNFIDNYK